MFAKSSLREPPAGAAAEPLLTKPLFTEPL